jgi:hypothetical protein
MSEEKTRVLPEVAMRAVKPEQFRQLRAGEKESRPHLKPTMTLSEMKLTIAPARTAHAISAMTATRRAVPAASALKKVASPPAISANDAPTSSEMADVTVMVVCRELQKSQKTKPEDRHA